MFIRTVTDIGLVIRERRRSLGLDQGELAGQAGVSRQWIVEIEKGKPRAEVGLVLRTLSALGLGLSVDAADELGGTEALRADAIPSIDIDGLLDDLAANRS
ncbi:helix-turn-helix transcriptional regulator [Skermanella mucosa]|uniref:helix-turn-helix transcriptional regulator n=1 Tax=Skermanella mucosa TaxID=1789672 RepID=UPI00192C8BD1|nr:helix-turn-helix transcriptional regulator [Skermanella mucosa]UEM20935.1 helix-turn-helix transcriptional regulator [Skermanella mucosa]